MDLIQQQEFGECGVSCLAMVLGLSREDVLRELREVTDVDVQRRGVNEDEMIAVLRRRGLADARHVVDRPDYHTAILTVPSLNHRGLLHYVVWDGEQGRYLDPAMEPLRYPDDGPVIDGRRTVCWAAAIIWGTDPPATPGEGKSMTKEPVVPEQLVAAFDRLMWEAHRGSVDHGFWGPGRDNPAEKIALMHSELSEALEGLRHGDPPSEHMPEYSAVEEELADLIIRVADLAGAKGYRLGEAIWAKLVYNRTRPFRHDKQF